MNLLPPESFLGAYRSIRSFLTRDRVVVAGKCALCGQCCTSLFLQIDGGFLDSEYAFAKTCEADKRYERFVVAGKDNFGALIFRCSMLVDNKCSDYAGRLDFCRTYPTINLYYTGQNLLPGCGYSFVKA